MEDIEWEDVVVNDNNLDDIEWEDAKPVTQSVMDDRDGQVYNVPLAFDGIDTRFAIDTQHKGADKGSFFGKVDVTTDNPFEAALTQIGENSYEKLVDSIEKVNERLKTSARTVVGHVGNFVDAAIVDATRLRDKQYEAEHGYSRYPSFFFGSDETQEEIKASAQEAVANIEKIRKNTSDWFKTKQENIKKEETFDDVDTFVAGVTDAALSVAEAVGATLVTKDPKTAAYYMANLFGSMRKNEVMDTALEKGIDFDKADLISTGAGVIEGGLEIVGDLALAKVAKLKSIIDIKDRVMDLALVKMAKSKLGKQAGKKLVSRHMDSVWAQAYKGVLSEGGEEGAQTSSGMIYENLTGLANYDSEEIINNTLFSIAVGGITGGAMGGAGTAYSNRLTKQTNDRLKALLKQDTPELTDQELQVTADAVQEMLFQETANYVGELNNVLSKEANADVSELRQEGLTPEQLTAETRKLLKEKYQMNDEDINKTIQSALSVIDARNQFNEAYTIFNEGLTNAGRDVARADGEARILAARALAVARAQGTQVKDVLDRWNLQFKQTAWNEGDIDGGAKNVAVKNVGYADFRNFIDEESNPVTEEVFNKIKEAISTYGNNIGYEELMNKVGKELDADMNAVSMSNSDFMEVFDYIAEPNQQALLQHPDPEKYYVLPDDIKNQRLNILTFDNENIKTKEDVEAEIQRLIDKNTTEETQDGKTISFVNAVYKKGNPSKRYKVASHIAYSSKKKQPEIRNNAVFNINDLIKNSVFVEEDTQKQDKRGYDKALRFYTAVRAGNEIYPVRIVALHKADTDSFDLSGNVYDVIFEEKEQGATASLPNKLTIDAGPLPDTISISDLLQSVKSSDGRTYYQMSYYDGLGSSKSVSDVKKLLKGLQPEEEVRLMFDKNKGYWFVIDAKDNIHQDMIVKAFEQGMYPEFRNSQEAIQYFDENYNADDEYLIRFKADSFIDNNDLQNLLDENIPSDEYKYGYSVKNADGSGYVLFARSLWDLADTPLKSIGKEAEIWERNPYKMTEFQKVEQKQLEDSGIFYQFAGENAQIAALDQLDRAKQLGSEGVDNEAIRQQTGWFKGPDGKWRFEISDADAVMLGTINELLAKHEANNEKMMKKVSRLQKKKDGLLPKLRKEEISEEEYYASLDKIDAEMDTILDKVVPLKVKDILKHDALFAAYPEVAEINVYISDNIEPNSAYFSKMGRSITVGTDVAKAEAKSIELKGVIMHEIQHAIQKKEDFATGGSTSQINDIRRALELNAEASEEMERIEFFNDKLGSEEKTKELLHKEYLANKALRESLDKTGDISDEAMEVNDKYLKFVEELGLTHEDMRESFNTPSKKLYNDVRTADAFDVYWRLYGEVEARNTAIRSEFSDKLRKEIAPERTQDVKNADAIVMFSDGTTMAYEPASQEQKQAPRGAYRNSIIYLFENADASTVIHELGHFFLDDMQKFADNETTKRQLEAIYKYVGSTDGNLTIEQHEYFANSFELYLLEGRAPNKTLEKVFFNFRKWISRIWSEIKRLSGINLTPEIRKVFDEMLGGRGLDFAMQMSGARMAEALESGTIPPNVIAKAIELLETGKMSRADMDDLITRMKNGDLKRKDFNQELKKFENSNVKHGERLNPFDKVKYKEALARGNFSKKDVLEKINRLLKWTEPRSQNGKVVGRFSNLKMNQEFDHIRELMNMEKAQAKEKLDENIKLINAMIRGEETGDMDRLVFDNKILTIRLNKANASLLLDVYNAISDSYNMGRLTTAVTGEARRARKNRLINEAVHVLTADGDVDWRRERGKLKQFVNQLGTSQMSWQGILDILSMNDKTSKTGQSLLVQNLDVFDAQQKEAQGLAEDGEKASRFMEQKLKGVGNAAISVSRYVNSKLDKKFTIQWGANKKTFTKDQLLDIYMKSKDDETRKMMAEDPILQYNERFLSEVNEILTAEDRAIAEALFEFYDDNYAKINAFYEEKYGTSLGKRAFYSPRSMDRGGVNVDTGDLSSYAGFSGVKERKAKAGAVKIKGAFQVLQDYIVNSNHWIAWSDKLIDINAVMGDVEVKNIIRNLFGEGMEKRIGYEVSRMASNDKFQSKFGYGKLFNKIRSNYAIAALAAKPSLMIKQLTSFPAYWEHMSTAEFMSGLADFAIHMKEAVETLGNTTLMKTRDVNIIKDFEELSKSELFKKNANKVKLRELLMANIKLGDRGAIYMGGWALYKAELKKNLAKGMSEEKAKALALEKFERVTDETQQSGRLSQQSYWQSNPFLRAFTMFQSSQNQYLRKEINAIRGLATGRMDKKQALKTLFIFHVLLPCFFQYASDGFDWDEKAQLRAALLGSLNGIFILNGVLERGLDYALGTADAWKATSTALSDVLPFWGSGEDLAKFFIDLAEGDIDLEDYVEVIRAFGKPLGELTGIPVKYPLDVIQNFGSYAEEGEVKKEVLLWLGWSPYALRDKEED